jgi:hypothetical protein
MDGDPWFQLLTQEEIYYDVIKDSAMEELNNELQESIPLIIFLSVASLIWIIS